jgi:hypothetical protein
MLIKSISFNLSEDITDIENSAIHDVFVELEDAYIL